MVNTLRISGRDASSPQPEWWIKDEAIAAYFLEHAPDLKQYYEAQDAAFSQIEDDALARHPDPTLDDIAAAESAEAALPSRKRTEAQLRRNFEPLATYLPGAAKRRRRASFRGRSENGIRLTHAPQRSCAARLRLTQEDYEDRSI
jgi:hypothetical protein